MSENTQSESSGFAFPEVFTDPSYEYSGSERDKERMVRADLRMHLAVCKCGQRPSADEFNRAMRKMQEAISSEAFDKILDEARGI
jgi:hypothetical protein